MSKSIFPTGYSTIPVFVGGRWYVEIIGRGSKVVLTTEKHKTREGALARAQEWLQAKPIDGRNR